MSDRQLMDVTPTGMPPGGVSEETVAQETGDKPSAEDQQLYDKFVTRAAAFMYSEQTERAVIDMLNQKDFPVHVNVGRTAAKVTQMVEMSAERAGQSIPENVIEGAGREIVELLMDMGVQAKIFPAESDTQETLDMAYLEGVKAYGEELLKGPEADKISADAQNHYVSQVASEADAGQLGAGMADALSRQEARSKEMVNG